MQDSTGSVKTSVFTVQVPDGDAMVWYNSASGEALRMATSQSAFLERHVERVCREADGLDDPLVQGLLHRGFLVPQAINEFEIAHSRYLSDRDDRTSMFLTIAPTLACNARCSYCFQQDLTERRPMDTATGDALVSFVRERSEGLTELAVQWFGGEPLLALDILERCTEGFRNICAMRGAGYRASILTNGMLLQKRALWLRVASLGITEIQIPLDGLPESYSLRKRIPLRQAERFYAFLVANAEEIAETVGRLIININVDRDNIDEACEVVDLFAAVNVTDPRVQLQLGVLGTDHDLVKCIPHNCLAAEETPRARSAFYEHLALRGMSVPGPPQPVPWPCVAVSPNYFTVDPEGWLGGCAPLTGSPGEPVLPGGLRPSVRSSPPGPVSPLHGHDPFVSSRCAPCRLLPACLGACPRRGPLGGDVNVMTGLTEREAVQGTTGEGAPSGTSPESECLTASRIIRQVVETSRTPRRAEAMNQGLH